MAQESWPPYPNLLPGDFANDLAAAVASGVQWGSAPSEDFDRLALRGDPLIYVVTQSGTLVVATQFVARGRIVHAVLADGLPVLAAGDVSLVVLGDYKAVIRLSNRSGHYRPARSCLELAAEVFRNQGFEVPNGAIDYVQ